MAAPRPIMLAPVQGWPAGSDGKPSPFVIWFVIACMLVVIAIILKILKES